MADSKDDERDEEWFKEVYGKEYTGPPRPSSDNVGNASNTKRKNANSGAGDSDKDDEARDPNAVPTDFTSREAKVWEAKAKAIEKNWKRRKEEELICRICGKSGHFTQGCPTTLGVNRKLGEFVERVPFKDKHLKAHIFGTGGSTIQSIEKDTGCHLKLEDSLTLGNGAFFVHITGSDRVMVRKAVDAVRKVVDQVEGQKLQNTGHTQGTFNQGSNVNPLIAAQMEHIAAQRMQHNTNMLPFPGRAEALPYDDRHATGPIDSQVEIRRQWEGGSKNGPGSLSPYGHKGGQGASGVGSLSSFYNSKGFPSEGGYYGKDLESREKLGGLVSPKTHKQDTELGYEQQSLPQTLEELEHRFVQETMELTKEQNDAEDKENDRHRECMRDIQEQYQQKMTALRARQGKYREDFLQREVHMRQQQYKQSANITPYNYNTSASSMGSLHGGSRSHLGYGIGGDPHPAYGGGYPLYREGGPYYTAMHPHSRNPGYNTGNMLSGNRGYDSAPYTY